MGYPVNGYFTIGILAGRVVREEYALDVEA